MSIVAAARGFGGRRWQDRGEEAEPLLHVHFSSKSVLRAIFELRPHGGCVESASVLRACLQGTTMVGSDDKAATGGGGATEKCARYALTTPQYHGPAREAIAAACKAVELEANCSGTG